MKKIMTAFMVEMLLVMLVGCEKSADENKIKMQEMYGINQEITTDYDKELSADCHNGTFVGVLEDDVLSFKGIPYAKAPIGELRWKEAVLAEESDSVYEAYYFGKTPIQTEWVSEMASYYPQGEDCLYLNIWTSKETGVSDKTVMVFFHGGSYGWGGTSDPLYDGQNFVEEHEDIVLVTVGYRTGIMGFLDLDVVDEEGEYSESGNLGLLDQIAALKWIQQNIEAFGGDPENVTIFGESAGAGSVSLLPMIDGTEGLFQRVIVESGSVALTYSTEECQNLTQRLLKESGAKTIDELLALSEEELMTLNEKLNDYNNFPERDGIVLPKDLYEAYANGEASHVDMLIGTNADECRYWIKEMGYYVSGIDGELIYTLGIPIMYDLDVSEFSSEDKNLADAFLKLQKDDKVWNITEFYNEILFRIPAIVQAESNVENGGNVYMYYWEYPSAIENLGACHAVELAYVFNNLDETAFTGDNINAELAEDVQQMWVNFAKTGNPSTEEHVWESYSKENRSTMILGNDIYMEQDLLSEQRELIEPLLGYGLNGSYMAGMNRLYLYVGIGIAVIILVVVVIIWGTRKYKK